MPFLILILPRGLLSQNEFVGQHWSKKHGDRDSWAWCVRAVLNRFPIAPERASHPRALTIHATKKRPIDLGNLIGGAKGLIDALVAEGLLVDDCPKWMPELNIRETVNPKVLESTEIILKWEEVCFP